MYWEKIMFYNNAFPVANQTENKQYIQGIWILSNRDLYPNTAPLDTVSPNIQGDNCWNKCCKLSSDSLHHHPKLHQSVRWWIFFNLKFQYWLARYYFLASFTGMSIFSAPMPQFSFRTDSMDLLNNGEFISWFIIWCW